MQMYLIEKGDFREGTIEKGLLRAPLNSYETKKLWKSPLILFDHSNYFVVIIAKKRGERFLYFLHRKRLYILQF